MEISEAELHALRLAFDWARDGAAADILQFLDAGGPVNLTNGRGDTLLILAAYHSRAEAVEALLDRGADVHRCNDNGQTALAAAVFRQRADVVGLLLSSGADPDEGPKSARAVAEFFGLTEMLPLLSA